MSTVTIHRSLCVGVALTLSMAACNREVKEAPAPTAKEAPPVQVKTVSAESRPMPRFITLTGTLAADRESKVAADVTGKVLEVLVDRGSLVKAGGVLAVLDKRSANIVSKEAEANVALARSNAEQVTKLRTIIEALGHEIATPAEARAMLGLKGGDLVGF